MFIFFVWVNFLECLTKYYSLEYWADLNYFNYPDETEISSKKKSLSFKTPQ